MRTARVAPDCVQILDLGAQPLNEAFAKPQGKANVFEAGDPLGALIFTAQAE